MRIPQPDLTPFLAFYLAYAVFLVMDAVDHPGVDELREAMLLFVLPLTVLALVVVTSRALVGRRG